MRAFTAADILHMWENGQHLHPIDRALALLGSAEPALPWEALARLPIGQRDAYLLRLRAQTVGPRLRGYAECPACSERLEFDLDSRQLLLPPSASLSTNEMSAEIGGIALQYRLPNSFDLAAAAACADVPRARRTLFERCVTHAQQGDAPIPIANLPDEVENGLAELLAQADPQADLQLGMECPACAHTWQLTFDAGEFFWVELNSLARRTLDEVHTLANAYGWHEADILAMSAIRRQAYLDKVFSATRVGQGKRL